MGLGLTAPISVEAEAPPIERRSVGAALQGVLPISGHRAHGGPAIAAHLVRRPGPQTERAPIWACRRRIELPGSGSALVGEAGTMVIPHWDVPRLFPEEKFRDFEIPAARRRQPLHELGRRLPGRRQDDIEFRLRGPAHRSGAAWRAWRFAFPASGCNGIRTAGANHESLRKPTRASRNHIAAAGLDERMRSRA